MTSYQRVFRWQPQAKAAVDEDNWLSAFCLMKDEGILGPLILK
jgi:hypothetical protein